MGPARGISPRSPAPASRPGSGKTGCPRRRGDAPGTPSSTPGASVAGSCTVPLPAWSADGDQGKPASHVLPAAVLRRGPTVIRRSGGSSPPYHPPPAPPLQGERGRPVKDETRAASINPNSISPPRSILRGQSVFPEPSRRRTRSGPWVVDALRAGPHRPLRTGRTAAGGEPGGCEEGASPFLPIPRQFLTAPAEARMPGIAPRHPLHPPDQSPICASSESSALWSSPIAAGKSDGVKPPASGSLQWAISPRRASM